MKVTLALQILLSSLILSFANDEDFAFESFDELGTQIQDVSTNWDAPYQHFNATSGRVFHLVVPKNFFGKNTSKFEAKVDGKKPLPRWLIFDKTEATFWGVPLDSDLGTIDLTVRALTGEKFSFKNIVIDVIPTPISTTKCSSSEDTTILSLLIDKWTETIKPKQRVVALNDISKFFGIPYSAFTLKPLSEKDDITDSSVIMAGPGNVNLSKSNSTSILEVPVGCDGRIFTQYTSLIHQLKQQAKDGTISEVIRLPIAGWRIKIRSDKTRRGRRQALEQMADDGSGEYDGEYYDDYEEETDDYAEEPEGLTPENSLPKIPPTTPRIIPTTTSKVNLENTSSHPHRHHHGEVKKEENMPIWTIVDDNSLGNDNTILPTSPEVPRTSPTRGTTTAATTTTISSTTTKKSTSPTKIKIQFPQTIDTYDDDYENYKTEDYEDEDNEDDLGEIESQTIVPVPKTSTSGTSTTSTTTTTTTTTEQFIIQETSVFEESTTREDVVEKNFVTADSESSYSTTTKSTIPVVITEIETTLPTTVSPITSTTPSTTVSTTAKLTTPFITTTPATTMTSTTTTPAPTTTSTPTTTTIPTTTTTPAPTTTAVSTTSTTESTTILPSSKTTTELSVEKEQTTQTKLTTLRHISSTSLPITTISESQNELKNEPPYIENRLIRKYVSSGKIFRFVIPENTFRDSEDNYDLKLEFLDINENPITANSWCQFNPHRREIYGLPLDDHVSKWDYFVRATDKDGAYVQDNFTVVVQQHKLQRVFNLKFSLELRIEKKDEFRHYVDYSLKTLRSLGRIFNTNMSEITVRNVTFKSHPIVFTWSNDSLPTNYCPKNEIEKLFKVLTANDRGDPSRELNNAVTPELRVKKVFYHGVGVCEELNKPIAPPVNFAPILRNPVNRINATIGEMLVFRVPKDTFYDPEDLDTLSLNLTLLTREHQEIPAHNWLQFDSKNREFFGIPRKTGRSEYQLVCVDSGGLPVIDSLEVIVYPAPKLNYNVEFSMTIETTHNTFSDNPLIQKKFVDKLMEVFDDGNTSHIQFLPFKQKQHSVIITWYNKTLSTEKCPQDQISKLESMMKNEERGISNRVHAIMEPDFQVSTIKVLPMSNCKVHKPKYHTPKMPEDRIVIDESAQTSSSDEYLLTFIVPVVVISIMTFFAVLAACILYRRRRTGKMNVLEEGRQSYGNKGIPVIFQEELDEKPEAGTKAPIILKDEKPPLAPPEYSKSGSLKFNDDSEPYHPPPPFTRTQENGKQSRPKPAPTYRKPPPYVPP